MNNLEGVLPAPVTPPNKEGEPKKGFSVKIENPDLIFKAIQDGKSGQLGKILMEKPIENIGISLKSGKEKGDAVGLKLFGEIDFESILAKTENASGADIAEIIRRTLEEKVRQEGTTGQEQPPISTEEIPSPHHLPTPCTPNPHSIF